MFYWGRKRILDFFFLMGKWPFLNLENVLFDGTDGWDGRVGRTGWTGRTGYQKCPLIFFILCGYIDDFQLFKKRGFFLIKKRIIFNKKKYRESFY